MIFENKNMPFSQLFFFIYIACTFLSCVSPSNTEITPKEPNPLFLIPSIYLNPSKIYPPETYLSAVGSGNTLLNAQKSALSTLAQQIKVQIKTSETLNQSVMETENPDIASFMYSTTLKEHTSISAQQQIQGVQYGESFTDETRTVHTIAYINRLSVGNNYKQQIDERKKQINKFIQASTKTSKLSKYTLLAKALTLSKKNDLQLEQLDVISPALGKISRTTSSHTSESISQKIQKTAKNIRIITETVVKGNDAQNIKMKINDAVITLFTGLQFSVNSNAVGAGIPHIISTRVIWEKITTGDYLGIQWNVNITLLENGQALISKSAKGRSNGKDILRAERFALYDITKIINTSFRDYILNQLTR